MLNSFIFKYSTLSNNLKYVGKYRLFKYLDVI